MVLLTAAPVGARFVCPSGRFRLEGDRSVRVAIPDVVELELGDGAVALPGVCPSVRGRRFLRGVGACPPSRAADAARLISVRRAGANERRLYEG